MFIQKAWRASAFGLYGYFNFTKSGFLKHSEKFKEEDMRVSVEGKNCVVTGANSGIGYATAQGLASRGATVYMVCRSKERGEAAVSQIQSETGNQNVYLEVCDLSSISQIKSFASRFSSKDQPVHVLVNNAGLLEHNRVITSEGLELNFAINVAGTYAITELMFPLLQKAAPDARVITVSSGGMYTSPLTTDLQFSEERFDGTTQYARNKRVQVALTEKWAEMYRNKGIGFYSMHPGWAETPGVARSLPGLSKSLSGNLRTKEEGADTILWLALQPKEKLASAFVGLRATSGGGGAVVPVASQYPRSISPSSRVKPSEVSIAGQHLCSMIPIALQHEGPKCASPLRKNSITSPVHDLSSSNESQHSKLLFDCNRTARVSTNSNGLAKTMAAGVANVISSTVRLILKKKFMILCCNTIEKLQMMR